MREEIEKKQKKKKHRNGVRDQADKVSINSCNLLLLPRTITTNVTLRTVVIGLGKIRKIFSRGGDDSRI